MRIVFMGTPDFAVASLRQLVEDGHEIVGVFTQPDKPGKRLKMTLPPVKVYAQEKGLAVYQPESMRGDEPLALLRSLAPELTVVAAYGQILPEAVLCVPRLGSVNVHASILPKYRGAAPINQAILDGETETGVTIMYMAKKLDAGDIIRIAKTPIAPDETAEELFDRLAVLGAQTLSAVIPTLADGTAQRIAQDDALSTYAHMLTREMSPIDWTKGSRTIIDQVRGLIPWPCATAEIMGKSVKVYRAEMGGSASDAPGKMCALKHGIQVACGDGQNIILTELQSEGGKRMAASAFLNGMRITAGTYLN